MSAELKLLYASKSEAGRRSSNDDAMLIDPNAGLYLICDGARGRFGGHIAAQLACEIIQNHKSNLVQCLDSGITPAVQSIVEMMLTSAHEHILEAIQSDPSLQGMTSTVAMVLHRGNQVLISHIGDSRVYFYREPQLKQLTTDHNLENYLKNNPHAQLNEEMSGKTLVRALGLKASNIGMEHKLVSLQKDDVLLLCTDGVTDSVPGWTLKAILAGIKFTSIEESADNLIRAALSHGSMDNISAIVLQVTDKLGGGPRTMLFEPEANMGQAPTRQIIFGWITFLDGPRRGQVLLLEASTVFGADPRCKVVIEDEFTSRRHAEIFRTEHGFVLRDLGSTNGTFINNVKANEDYLVDNDFIRVGCTELLFKSHKLNE